MKKFLFLFIILLSQTIYPVISQTRPSRINPFKFDIMTDDMKLSYFQPSGFEQIRFAEDFEDYPKLRSITSGMGTTLRSIDLECIAFFSVYKPFTVKDVDEMNRMFPHSPIALDEMHIGQIRGNIVDAYGKEVSNHWKDYVTYYSAEEAKQKESCLFLFYSI